MKRKEKNGTRIKKALCGALCLLTLLCLMAPCLAANEAIEAQPDDAFNEDIARALSAGMSAHVAKPIQPDALAKALAKAFGAECKTE